jgi:sigma-B regulation protein RsbU (phosphoserine phosphatase)
MDMVSFAIAVVICGAGSAAIAAHFARRNGRERLLLWFGLFAAIYGVRMFFKQTLAGAVGISATTGAWVEVTLNYLILIPSMLFAQELYGPGWRNSMRWLTIGVAVYGGIALLADVSAGNPRRFPDPSLGLLVGVIVSLIAGARAGYRPPPVPEWRVLVTAIVVFLLFVVHEHAVGAGLLPWRVSVEPVGFLVQLGCLGYIAVSRFFSQENALAAVAQEMRSAREIQASILPHTLPEIPGVTIAARYLPLAAVAGDFYDVVALPDGGVAILVADVSGHGVPAALIASMVKVAFASALNDTDDPGAVLRRMNTTLCGMFARSYVTAACTVLRPAARSLEYALAGHPPPLLLDERGAVVTELNERGLALGFMPSASYTTATVPLEKDSRLVLYTDGIMEAPDERDDQFGLERLGRLAVAERAAPPAAFADRLIAELHRFTGATALSHDDLTLVVADVAILHA